MTVKNGINQIGVLVGGGPAPRINSVIHAITGEAVRHHKAVIGLYNGFKCLMKENLVNIRLTQDVVGYIYLEGGSILRSARANPTKSPETLRKVATPLQYVGINALSLLDSMIRHILPQRQPQVCPRSHGC